MHTIWTLRWQTATETVESGEAAVLRGGQLYRQVQHFDRGGEAFFRARGRPLCVAAAPGQLLVDGKPSVSGIAIVSGGRHTLGIGDIRVEVCSQSARLGYYSGPDEARCALSGEIITAGEDVVECTCGVTMVLEFARQHDACCPRCGQSIPDWRARR